MFSFQLLQGLIVSHIVKCHVVISPCRVQFKHAQKEEVIIDLYMLFPVVSLI